MTTSAPGTPGGTPEQPARFFRGPEEFRAWLEANHDSADELWMGLYKKHVPDQGLTWVDAVPEALCFGWIDSRAERIDDDARRQRWTPRRRGSTWSKVNIELVARLTAEGRMQPAGLAAFEQRREDRSGIYTHETEARELPDDQAQRLAANPRAAAFWARCTPSYRRIAVHWVLGAKQAATREKRFAQLIDDCAAGRVIPPQRYGAEPKWVAEAAAAAESAG